MKAIRAGVASALLVAGLGMSPATPAVAAPVAVASATTASTTTGAPYCGIRWGSTAKTKKPMSSARVVDVRTGRHACFDRFVVDLRGKVKGYDVRYVKAVHTEGEGRKVPLAGAADLQIIVKAPAYTDSGRATYDPRNDRRIANVKGYRTFRQAAFLGSFEGQTSFGLGVRARLPFRTFVLTGPGNTSRLVVDVAHRW